jgi:thymidylate synthase
MNIEHDYLKLLKDILDNGVQKQDRTGTGTISVFGRQIRHDMKLGFPLLTTKKMPFRLIALELIWFLRGDTNIKFLVDNDCHIWDGDAYKNYVSHQGTGDAATPLSQEEFINQIKCDEVFARKWGELGPIYGAQWRKWYRPATREEKIVNPGVYNVIIDQFADLVTSLTANPDSRRLMVTAWNPGQLDQMVLPPCHYGFQVWTRELSESERFHWYGNKTGSHMHHDHIVQEMNQENVPTRAISLSWNQRSIDVFLGLPFNIASYALLLEIIAKSVNMVPDQLVGNLGDTHLYLNHIEQAKEQLNREPMSLPTLNINTEHWPCENGEFGEGPIDSAEVFNGFRNYHYCNCFIEDLQLSDYQSHPSIKAPLSN